MLAGALIIASGDEGYETPAFVFIRWMADN